MGPKYETETTVLTRRASSLNPARVYHRVRSSKFQAHMNVDGNIIPLTQGRGAFLKGKINLIYSCNLRQ
jgi:hypothetical protein